MRATCRSARDSSKYINAFLAWTEFSISNNGFGFAIAVKSGTGSPIPKYRSSRRSRFSKLRRMDGFSYMGLNRCKPLLKIFEFETCAGAVQNRLRGGDASGGRLSRIVHDRLQHGSSISGAVLNPG